MNSGSEHVLSAGTCTPHERGVRELQRTHSVVGMHVCSELSDLVQRASVLSLPGRRDTLSLATGQPHPEQLLLDYWKQCSDDARSAA